MSVVPSKYRPPFCTQRGIDSTLDDCSVVATLHGIADATSGEFVTKADGQEMARPELQALARKLRRSTGDSVAGLTIGQRQEMCRKAGFPEPQSVDIRFKEAIDMLRSRTFSLSISGIPGRIVGPSPLKRTNVSHEWFIWGTRGKADDLDLLYFDGMNPAKPEQRGEWGPARWLRQMAFKDSDGELNFVLKYPVGGWREVVEVRRDFRREKAENVTLSAKVDGQATRIERLRADLAACEAGQGTDCSGPIAAAWERAGVEAIAFHERQRQEGP